MANVKYAGIRELIVGSCLQNRDGLTVLYIMNACNDALKVLGLRLITTPTRRNETGCRIDS